MSYSAQSPVEVALRTPVRWAGRGYRTGLNVLKLLWEGAEKSYFHRNHKPTDVVLFLTYRCTNQCKACTIWQRPVNQDEELTWEDWRPVFEKFKRGGIKSVELFGGDALLRKELLFQMIRFCSENGMATYLPTNSNGLTDETARQMVDAGLGTIYFSLDESDGIEGQVRGVKGHTEKVRASIQRIRDERGDRPSPVIEVITTVSGMNYRHLHELASFARDAGADAHEFRGITEFTTPVVDASSVNGTSPEPYFMPSDSHSHGFTPEQANELLEILKDLRRRRGEFAPMRISMMNMEGLTQEHLTTLEYPQHDCLFCTTQMNVTPYGDVIPCPYFNEYRLGNLLDEDIPDVWGSDRHREFTRRQQSDKIPMCSQCSIRPYHQNLPSAVRTIARRVTSFSFLSR